MLALENQDEIVDKPAKTVDKAGITLWNNWSFRSIFVPLCALDLISSGCSQTEELPEQASQVVLEQAGLYYTSPYLGAVPFEAAPHIRIQRAWLGDEAATGGEPSSMWCVELQVSGVRQGLQVTDSPIWIAVPDQSEQGKAGTVWSASALELISSSIPYERCGQVPGQAP
jgi:hypothetical protein